MKAYDGSFRDVANRLRDDELISLKLVHTAADMIELYGTTLERIMEHLDNSNYSESGVHDSTIVEDIFNVLNPVDNITH